jgi:hypothetical protein
MRSTILALSLVLGVVPLVGIGWIFATGMIKPWPPSFSVDGLFMSMILLVLSLCFFLNAYFEARDQGLLKFMQKAKAAPAAAAKSAVAAKTSVAPKTPPASQASSAAPSAKVSS